LEGERRREKVRRPNAARGYKKAPKRGIGWAREERQARVAARKEASEVYGKGESDKAIDDKGLQVGFVLEKRTQSEIPTFRSNWIGN